MTETPYEVEVDNESYDMEANEDQMSDLNDALQFWDAQESDITESQEVTDTTVSEPTSTSPTSTAEYYESGKIKGVRTLEFAKQQHKERKQWQSLPQGEERDALKRAWNIKYYGEENPSIWRRTKDDWLLRAETDAASIGGPAAALGLIDTGTDAVNLGTDFINWSTRGPIGKHIPDIPNIPKFGAFESKALEATRLIAGLILPMQAVKGAVYAKAVQAQKSGVAGSAMQKLGANRLFKWFAETGLELGVGAGVDYVAEQNQRDDNATGALKKMFGFLSWIPNSIATTDLDSPDLKRAKNIREGAYLQFLASWLEAASLLGQHLKSVQRAGTEFIPESATAKANLKTFTSDEFSDKVFDANDPINNQLLKIQAREEKAFNELGEYHLATDTTSNTPKLGAHDVFDANETSFRGRDVDGAAGASVDAVRIEDSQYNSSYGRLGSILTEHGRQLGITTEGLSNREIVKSVTQELENLGEYGARLADGKTVTYAQIDRTGQRLAQIITDPRLEQGDLRVLLNEFKDITDKGFKVLKNKTVINKGLKKAQELFKNDLANMTAEKARAYVLTSEAGKIADTGEAARLVDGTSAASRAQEQILDSMKLLMVESDLARYQSRIRSQFKDIWAEAVNTNNPDIIEQTFKQISEQSNTALANVISKTDEYIDTLKGIKNEQPDFLRPFILAHEFTDGNIDTMHKLHKFMQNKLGVFKKLVNNGTPAEDSILIKSKMAVLFNSVLSSIGTPIRALIGNAGGLIGRPISVFSGALLRGDVKTMRRAWHQYTGLMDSMMKASDHMKIIYRKAASDPTSVSYMVREDIVIKEASELAVLEATAAAYAKNGEHGAEALISIYKRNMAIAQHPWLRFGANSMTSFDGFTRSLIASAEAKGKAFDAIMESGQEFSEAAFKKASDDVYKSFFDSDGLITDKAVDFATREIALNLDGSMVKGLNKVLQQYPLLRSIFMFPRTQANSIAMLGKWSPLGLIFGQDFQKFNRNFDDIPIDDVKQLLSSKGVDWTDPVSAKVKFNELKAEITGRLAIGTGAMSTAAFLAMNGNIRGTGHWDPQVQRNRKTLGWERKTFKGLDGKWYSYEFLGPVGDLIASSVDLVDNFDSISTSTFEKMEYKLSYILAAGLTDKSMLRDIEMLEDVLSLNPRAWKRWTAQLANAWIPGAGFRSDLGKLIAPGLRDYDEDIVNHIRNRNSYLDLLDPKGGLPYRTSFTTGKRVGFVENMWVRFRNTYSEFSVHENPDPVDEFLMDIEFDSQPFFNVSSGGIEYDMYQRRDLRTMVGEQGYFAQKLKEIKADAEKLQVSYNGKLYTGYEEIMRAVRADNIPASIVDGEDLGMIFTRLEQALRRSVKSAEKALMGTGRFTDIHIQEQIKEQKKRKVQTGDVQGAINLQNEWKNFSTELKSR